MAAKDVDIATQLHDWAVKEMHFHPQGAHQSAPMPTPESLRRICRGAHQADIWQYVVNHIRSIQTVKNVKGNIQLRAKSSRPSYKVKYKSDDQYDHQVNELMDKKAQLLQDVTTVLSETRQLENELGRTGSDIQKSELTYQQEVEAIRDLSRRSCMLQVFTHTCENLAASCDAFADKIDVKQQGFVSKSKGVDTALHTRVDENADDQESVSPGELETTTARDTRTSCENIGRFFHHMLQGTFGTDKSSLSVNKDHLWKQVETVLSDHHIDSVVDSLTHLSKLGSRIIKQHSAKINIQKDAEKLRFKYERGGLLTDIAQEPTFLRSVEQLLEDKQMQHMMRFVETKKHHNTARPLLEHLETTRNKINTQLKIYFTNQPGTVGMATVFVQSQLELVADRTAVELYRRETDRLREAVCQGVAGRDSVRNLHCAIQNFQQIANSKQNLIQVVAKQNNGAKSRLSEQKLDVCKYIARSIPQHNLDTQTLTSNLRGTITDEVDTFAQLALPFLLGVYLDSENKCGMLDMSVNHTSHPTAIKMRQALHNALSHLQFPMYKAPECILPHCVQLKREKEECEETLSSIEAESIRILYSCGIHTDIDKVTGVVSERVTELCDKVYRHDKDLIEKLQPILGKRLSKTARSSAECIRVKDCVQSWWDQPSQFVTPWVVRGDATYQQWYNKWRVLVTRLRQHDG